MLDETKLLQVQQTVQTPIADVTADPLVIKLTYQEQVDFSRICSYFQLADDRNKRNFGMSTFIKHLNLIHRFVVRDDGGDALRGLVCGILFGNGFLLVNTEKLKKLTRRSKSCVNGCFQRLGFGVFRETQDLNGFFSKIFPDIGPLLLNPRHWCIRKASDEAPICFISSLPLDISAKFGFPVETYQMMSYSAPQQQQQHQHHMMCNPMQQMQCAEQQSCSSSADSDTASEPETHISFFQDIRSLLNRPKIAPGPASIPRMQFSGFMLS